MEIVKLLFDNQKECRKKFYHTSLDIDIYHLS